jgi:serine protease AprX
MKNCIVAVSFKIILAFLFFDAFCQITPQKYWIGFSDKNNSPYSIDNPREFLSERALSRRERQTIKINVTDLPVNTNYIDSLKRMGCKVINVSKWFNGVIVSIDDTVLLESIKQASFVKQPIIQVSCRQAAQIESHSIKQSEFLMVDIPDYGRSENQIVMLRGDYLHQQGYEGENMIIAIEDAGFANANNINSLSNLWMSDRVIALRDFVKDSLNILEAHYHGTLVLSIIAGISDQIIYGTATQAEFALIRTEDAGSECLIEEYNWACGAEFADSLGTDVINTSLGYSTFNDPLQNHRYKDMDGKTIPIAIAADIAASKGMLVVVSAGNEANNSWYRITSPADAINILAVGAVNPEGIISNFSSRGPSYDKRVKPDVCAQGVEVIAQSENGSIVECNGTSCAAPLIAGLATCLWQANQQASSQQIIEAIRQSGSICDHPDSLYGYGIANFFKADRILKYMLNPVEDQSIRFNLFPNPVRDHFYVEIVRPEIALNEKITISYIDLMGRTISMETRNIDESYSLLEFQNIQYLPTGIYTLRIELPEQKYSLRFMKVR